MKVVSDKGEMYYKTNLNLLESKSLSITNEWSDYSEPKIELSFTVKNNLGIDIKSIHICAGGDERYFGKNLLKNDLKDGFSLKINYTSYFSYDVEATFWNVIAIDNEHNAYKLENVDLKNTTSLTFEKSNKQEGL